MVEVDLLAAAHSVRAGVEGQPRGGAGPLFGVGVRFGQQAEGLDEQRVAGEDGGRLAEFLMVGRFAAAEIVVVHRGQVVVDEGRAVDQLYCGGEPVGQGRAERVGKRGGDEGTDALAAVQRGIAAGLVQLCRAAVGRVGEEAVQQRVGARGGLAQRVGQAGAHALSSASSRSVPSAAGTSFLTSCSALSSRPVQ